MNQIFSDKLQWLKDILSGHIIVSDNKIEKLVRAYAKLYEAKGEFFRDDDLNLRNYSADDVLEIISSKIEILSDDFNEIRMKNRILENKLQKSESFSDDTSALKEKCDELSKELERKEAELEKVRNSTEKDFVKVANTLIPFRDSLFLMQETAKEQENDTVLKIITGLIRSSKATFENCGIKVLDECGQFDSSIQKIIATVPTDNPDLDASVAENFRCGYIYNNSVLRLQEVKVYKSLNN